MYVIAIKDSSNGGSENEETGNISDAEAGTDEPEDDSESSIAEVEEGV